MRAAIAAGRPAEIYHLAGAANQGNSWDRTDESLRANALGTHHLLDALRRERVDARVLVIGSAAVYRPMQEPFDEESPIGPTSPYGVSKLAQEMTALQSFALHGQHVIVSRSFNHIGPRQSADYVASSFARQIAMIEAGQAPPVILVGNLEARRDLMDVRDTVRAYRALMRRGEPGRAYNVCSGEAHAIRELLDGLLAHSHGERGSAHRPVAAAAGRSAAAGGPARSHQARDGLAAGDRLVTDAGRSAPGLAHPNRRVTIRNFPRWAS